jgi:hypothetical protein
MTMIMRTASSAKGAQPSLARKSWVRQMAGSLERWMVTYMDCKIEQAAIARLRSMSDRELKDIGVSRSDIAGAVRRNSKRYCAFSRYY